MTTTSQQNPPSVTLGDHTVALGDVYESSDYRDTDPQQPNNRRRVRIVKLYVNGGIPTMAKVMNLTTLRETGVNLGLLTSRKWRKVHDATKAAAGLPA